METHVFDGRAAAAKIKDELKREADSLNLRPKLAVVLVGSNEASLAYIRQKQKSVEALGWASSLFSLPEEASLEEIKKVLLALNADSAIDGVILQLPLPRDLPSYEATSLILPRKDIDGLNPQSPFTPPTALAVAHVLVTEGVKVAGAKVVVYGRGPTAGLPVANLLYKLGGKIFVVHSKTPTSEASRATLAADIIISCVGKPNLITGSMTKEGAVIIGVGISRAQKDPGSDFIKSSIKGDLDTPSLFGKASLITPTPGGIGPLTVAFLLANLLRAARQTSSILV